MKWRHLIKISCRIYGRQISDGHSLLEEVKNDLYEKFPRFTFKEPIHDYLPLMDDEIDAAESRGLMISYTNAWTQNKTVAHVICYSYVFTMQCNSQEEALITCEEIEEQMPEMFTSIQIQSSSWLDRVPH